MITVTVTLFSLLLGVSPLDYCYLDQIEQGIERSISDKQRKKELRSKLEDYEDALKAFNGELKSHTKELKKASLDPETSIEWYRTFLDQRMSTIKSFQSKVIETRLALQLEMTEAEWQAINLSATEQTEYVSEKRELFDQRDGALVNSILDLNLRRDVRNQLVSLDHDYELVLVDYNELFQSHTGTLIAQASSNEDFQNIIDSMNEMRSKLQSSYLDFIKTTYESTTDDERVKIWTAFNETID